MPRLSRAHYQRELLAWVFLPIMLSAVEGGIAAVLAKNIFAGTVSPTLVNIAVAVISGAPAFACVVSFLWAGLSNGRHKVRFLFGLQVATAVCVALVALAPRNAFGLLVLALGVVGARVCWTGVITIRSTVWRVNYPRHSRARLAGKLATVQAIILSLMGLVVGAATQVQEDAFRVIFPTAAALGLVGTFIYRRLRVRGHRALVLAEREDTRLAREPGAQSVIREVLRDVTFRRYMMCMFVFGSGNLMVTTLLVIMLRDLFQFREFASMLVVASIPTILMPLSIPWWSRLLDRLHIVRFRAVHGWAFVISNTTFLLGAMTLQPWLLFAGAITRGIAIGGGVLGWNLGHHDFAPRHRAGQYMGVHVTLTGIRGFLAPAGAVLAYELIEARTPGAGWWAFLICVGLSLAGTIGFCLMVRAGNAAASEEGMAPTATQISNPAPGP